MRAAFATFPTRQGAVRMRVAVVTPTYAPSTGGAELYHQRVAEHLALTANVLVLTADLNLQLGAARTDRAVAGGPKREIEVRYLPSVRLLGERFLLPWSLWRAISRFQPDVVLTSHPSLTGDTAGLLCLVRGTPWFATYHGDLNVGRFYTAGFSWWEARVLRRTRTILVHSDGVRDQLVARGLAPDRVRAVTPGPGWGGGTPPPSVDAAAPTRPGPEHPFLFVGGLDRARAYKQPEILLRALARLRGGGVAASAWIVGDGDRRAQLEHEAAQLGLSNAVLFLGRLSEVELASRYQRAWALVLPSTGSEGFGLVTLEALHFGCPSIVSSAVGAAPTLLREGCAVSFDADRMESLVEIMRSLWTDVDRRAELARRARLASTHYTWESAFPQIEETIASAGRTGARGGM
ncbi:MAG TPA: glycosyltransferase [Thermoplasmata archaeon]